MSRKDTLKAMLSRRENELPHGNLEEESHEVEPATPPEKKLQHIRSGAVGAMGRSLGNIVSAADQARALIAEGSAVVEIHPEKIDGSFVSDRLPDDGDSFQQLLEAIRVSGQNSPVLLRPHPENTDRYQVVFGHRRVRVASTLKRAVKAVVQNLSDEEMVVAQGQENASRTDLSYIERGLFALALEERGFDRHVIMRSLGMEKTQLSKLMAVAHSVPRAVIEAIGPAPKAGRPRWMGLAEKLAISKPKVLEDVLQSKDFRASDTDARFALIMEALTAKRKAGKAETIKSGDGQKLATVQRSTKMLNLSFDEKTSPAFGDFVIGKLEQLHHEFKQSQER
ncbi:plasmid partitioning protein RepB [Pararhizobium sp. YC-54]|uniref:plasmid partitioning protein RepB n=1 Tax=Pararhizobium sp. YC-54 TaxID=2986920 RepID=UPI0021F717DE|nr:plasmid partitioning protein RepB [Pararhizobium sp. YC-54]MCW0001558.1 plasmid partitioning protein RepB [Pararhizobium sp. YC-54]